MPVTSVSEAPNRELYESVIEKVNLVGERPTGLILHTAGETATGTVQIVYVWESHADAEAFERNRLFPAFEAAGIIDRVKTSPQPVTTEAFKYVA